MELLVLASYCGRSVALGGCFTLWMGEVIGGQKAEIGGCEICGEGGRQR